MKTGIRLVKVQGHFLLPALSLCQLPLGQGHAAQQEGQTM